MALGNKTLVLTPEEQSDLIDAINTRMDDLREHEHPAADAEINRLEVILERLERK